MALPSPWVDKIFEKLSLVYGRDFIGRWEGLNIDAVKADWAHELDGFQQRPQAIKHGLETLPPSKPPTVLEFREICRRAPEFAPKALPEPKATPEQKAQVRALLEKTRRRLVGES